MSPRRAVLAMVVTLAALVAWLPAQAAAAGCGERAPAKLTFKRTPGQATGMLAWRAPRNRPFGGTRYRSTATARSSARPTGRACGSR